MSHENVDVVRRSVACVVCGAALLLSVAPAQAAFPGRNGRIALNDGGSIFTVQPGGSGRRLLVRGTEGDPSYSADGRRVVFTGAATIDTSKIEVVRADGRERREITRGDPHSDAFPSWSPDGRVAFWRQDPCATRYVEMECPPRVQRSRNHGILIYRRGRTRVLATDGYQPTWSPDGTLVAFTRDPVVRGDSVHEVWVKRPDGSGQRRVLQRRNRDFEDLEWSPDSRKIVFTSSSGRAIDVVRRDGSVDRLIRNGQNPAYSPSGRQIVFSRANRHCALTSVSVTALWIMRSDGTKARMLRDRLGRPVCGEEPSWQPLP